MNYSVYLIDDEPLAIEQMKSQIPWQQFNMQVAGSSTSPIEALREIEQIRPHAVFTDMKMPGMDGTKLAEKVQSILPESEIIIVSAWSDFEYVRAALRGGCFDYLLKPLKESEYTQLLEQLYKKLQKMEPELQHSGPGNTMMRDMQNWIRAHIKEKISLTDLSDQFHLSQNAVCSYFNRYLNTTFVSYLTELRMKRAEKLLGGTSLNIKEIALECGYEDYFYFCRVFQRTYHCTPTQLRAKLLSEDYNHG